LVYQYIPIQKAAIEAYDNQDLYLHRLKNKYLHRMKNVSRIFNKYGFDSTISNGTFYLYIKVPSIFKSADELCRFLLDNCGIFTIPWDEVEPHIRLSMTFKTTNTEKEFYENLEQRLKRICK
jgi:LL-diaminopimelate aminotransferase